MKNYIQSNGFEMSKNILTHKIIDSLEIKKRNRELALEISNYYKNEEILVIGVLKGCIYFLSDLTKLIDCELLIEMISISSYRGKERSNISLNSKLDFDIKDKNVLIIEDIVDSGNTINFLVNQIKAKKPSDIKIVSFLFKPSVYKFKTNIDWIGFEIDDDFVIGYGLDYYGMYRNKQSVYKIIN